VTPWLVRGWLEEVLLPSVDGAPLQAPTNNVAAAPRRYILRRVIFYSFGFALRVALV